MYVGAAFMTKPLQKKKRQSQGSETTTYFLLIKPLFAEN